MARTDTLKAFEEGNAKMSSGFYEEAIALYDQAILQTSDNAFAFFNRGQALKKTQRFDAAIADFDHAIALRPNFIPFYEVLGGFLFDVGRYAYSAEILRQGLDLEPNSLKLLTLLSKVLVKLGLHDEALPICEAALALNPDDAQLNTALGSTLFSLHRYLESVAAFSRAVTLRPGQYRTHFNLAVALGMAGSSDLAIAAFDKAIAIDPDRNSTHVSKATCQLKMGDYEGGWKLYERRIDLDSHFGKFGFDKPLWTGQAPIEGKTILVHAEFGLGDTIQFCRYIPELEGRGATVLFAPQPKLQRLMRSVSDTVRIVDVDDPSLTFDFHCRIMSLPLAFGATVETISATTPYLKADPKRVARWKEVIGQAGFKIGICWRGSRIGDEKGLSFAPLDLVNLAAIPGVRLISLQKSDDPGECDALSRQTMIETQLDPADLSEDGMLDTAALISVCDLVISCDTSIAHLAGALGQPTWVVMPVDGDWRWLDRRADSPWYPTMRLFRPTLLGSRQAVFEAVEAELRLLLNDRVD